MGDSTLNHTPESFQPSTRPPASHPPDANDEYVSKALLFLFTPANFFVSLMKKMAVRELVHRHKITELKTNFVDMKERIGNINKRIATKFDKIESALECQGERLESDLQRQGEKLERAMGFGLWKIFGLVCYSHYSYSCMFSKGVLLQVVVNGGMGYWLSNKTSQDPKPFLCYHHPAPPPGLP